MFRVEWNRAPLNSAMLAWTEADDRNAITDAIEAIDRDLARDPANAGESRPNGQRIAFALPLVVRYHVFEHERLVVVVACWRVRKRSR